MLDARLPTDDDRIEDLTAVCSANLQTFSVEVSEEELENALSLLAGTLGGETRAKVFLLMMQRWFRAFEASELASRLGKSEGEVADAIEALSDLGVVEGRQFPSGTTYAVNRDHPLVTEIGAQSEE